MSRPGDVQRETAAEVAQGWEDRLAAAVGGMVEGQFRRQAIVRALAAVRGGDEEVQATAPVDAYCNGYGSGRWALETTDDLTTRIERLARERGVFPGVLVAEAVSQIGRQLQGGES